ncbi:glycosyl transferase family 28 [Dyadobacter jiangsuensis]|uniref:Glycosyl transferase family 28 n=2 Tax=Dyadobacter jiangsuensis TaxID=1591085 RepID=A0A2P8FL81_9BACT|nr:glycosyl transferase family 28 [Dyadobacter jiangsuensis]
MQATHQFDLVVSDNRYGLKIEGLKSVILTHQLQIMTGFGSTADSIMRRLHYRMLEKFDECWVVDEPENGGLAGALSHPRELPANSHYIGLLSQLLPPAGHVQNRHNTILVLLSGPEPMRSILEENMLQQAVLATNYHFHIIAGNPSGAARAHLPAHITYSTYARTRELADALIHARLVICRSGYSTLMDLAVFEKKALLIPTPGQSEQEYLAGHLQTQGIALSKRQEEVNLGKDITEALGYQGFTRKLAGRPDLMQVVLDNTLQKLENEAGLL